LTNAREKISRIVLAGRKLARLEKNINNCLKPIIWIDSGCRHGLCINMGYGFMFKELTDS